MNLSQYLNSTGVKKKWLAHKAKISPATLSRILQGSDCSLSVAIDLYLASDGNISLLDLNKEIKEGKKRSVKYNMVNQGANDSDKQPNA